MPGPNAPRKAIPAPLKQSGFGSLPPKPPVERAKRKPISPALKQGSSAPLPEKPKPRQAKIRPPLKQSAFGALEEPVPVLADELAPAEATWEAPKQRPFGYEPPVSDEELEEEDGEFESDRTPRAPAPLKQVAFSGPVVPASSTPAPKPSSKPTEASAAGPSDGKPSDELAAERAARAAAEAEVERLKSELAKSTPSSGSAPEKT